MIVFDLFLQAPDFFRVREPPAQGFAFLLTGIEGIGSVEDRLPLTFEFDLEKLTDDRASAHLLDGGEMAQELLTEGAKLG
jgi:hypothetical protein